MCNATTIIDAPMGLLRCPCQQQESVNSPYCHYHKEMQIGNIDPYVSRQHRPLVVFDRFTNDPLWGDSRAIRK